MQGVPAILLVGGGEGMGKLQATVEQLDMKLQGSAQVITVHELCLVPWSLLMEACLDQIKQLGRTYPEVPGFTLPPFL